MKTTSAKIICDSVNPDGQRITTYLLTYQRFIHSELMTHRCFSRNAASSRAIPIDKMLNEVRFNPATPVRWGTNGKGMQDHGVLEEDAALAAGGIWRAASLGAVADAESLQRAGLHKQLCNRVVEPFVWMTTLLTGTDFENFFALRVHQDAQPEFQHLAHLMLREYVSNEPEKLNWGQWHIPYGDQMPGNLNTAMKLKVATARAARTSYLSHEGAIDIHKDFDMHDRLATAGHWSPFEHPACAAPGRHANFNGWYQYRQTFPFQNRTCDLKQLLHDYEASIDQVSAQTPVLAA